MIGGKARKIIGRWQARFMRENPDVAELDFRTAADRHECQPPLVRQHSTACWVCGKDSDGKPTGSRERGWGLCAACREGRYGGSVVEPQTLDLNQARCLDKHGQGIRAGDWVQIACDDTEPPMLVVRIIDSKTIRLRAANGNEWDTKATAYIMDHRPPQGLEHAAKQTGGPESWRRTAWLYPMNTGGQVSDILECSACGERMTTVAVATMKLKECPACLSTFN